jgi:Zinc carboxypeptidase
MYMKNILLIVAALLIIAGSGYYFFIRDTSDTYTKTPVATTPTPTKSETATQTPVAVDEVPVVKEESGPTSIIGKSVEGNDIIAYHFGSGETELLFIGGIHGGYSWNTTLLGFELVDWLKANEDAVPDNVRVTIIPVLNPDGLKKVTGSTERFTAAETSKVEAEKIAGRFNANEVDLNRNFDCEWKATGTWQNRAVSGGSAAFSEPESKAIKAFVAKTEPAAVVAWYSAAGGVYASNCNNGPSKNTLDLTNLFAKASGYKAYEEFDYYEITGDMVNWLASQNIPAISVLLTNHEQTEFAKNKAGVEAIIKEYAN